MNEEKNTQPSRRDALKTGTAVLLTPLKSIGDIVALTDSSNPLAGWRKIHTALDTQDTAIEDMLNPVAHIRKISGGKINVFSLSCDPKAPDLQTIRQLENLKKLTPKGIADMMRYAIKRTRQSVNTYMDNYELALTTLANSDDLVKLLQQTAQMEKTREKFASEIAKRYGKDQPVYNVPGPDLLTQYRQLKHSGTDAAHFLEWLSGALKDARRDDDTCDPFWQITNPAEKKAAHAELQNRMDAVITANARENKPLMEKMGIKTPGQFKELLNILKDLCGLLENRCASPLSPLYSAARTPRAELLKTVREEYQEFPDFMRQLVRNCGAGPEMEPYMDQVEIECKKVVREECKPQRGFRQKHILPDETLPDDPRFITNSRGWQQHLHAPLHKRYCQR